MSTELVIPETLQQERQNAIEAAHNITIVDPDTFSAAGRLLTELTRVDRGMETLRKQLVQPFQDGIKNINARFAVEQTPISEAVQVVRQKMSAYDAKVREAAAKERERLRKLEQKRHDRQVAKGVTPDLPIMPPPQMQIPDMKVETPNGGVTMRTVVKFEVVDPKQVPAEFWIIDEGAIGKQVRAGRRDIPGVRIWEDRVPATRLS